MNREFIPYEQAVALKELGFTEPCLFHVTSGEINFYRGKQDYFTKNDKSGSGCSAILYQQAFKWFREYFDLYSEILLDRTTYPKYCFEIYRYNDFGNWEKIEIVGDWFLYKSFEEAQQDCLIELIRIAKKTKI